MTTEKVVDGVTFEPVVDLTPDLHPCVFSFLAVLDVPLYHRTDNNSSNLSSYYIDEQLLLCMLKPSMTTTKHRVSQIHSLDSVQEMVQHWNSADDDRSEVSHWSSVHRDLLFAGIDRADRRFWEETWRLGARKITLLSLGLFREYCLDLERALRSSITDVDLPFDVWWQRQLKSALFRNYAESSIGLVLQWLTTFDLESLERKGVVLTNCSELTRTHATEIQQMTAQYTLGTLWISCTDEEQHDARQGGCEFFRCWYDWVRGALRLSLTVWQPDDGSRPVHMPVVKRKSC
jgi:hypothetical protein